MLRISLISIALFAAAVPAFAGAFIAYVIGVIQGPWFFNAGQSAFPLLMWVVVQSLVAR